MEADKPPPLNVKSVPRSARTPLGNLLFCRRFSTARFFRLTPNVTSADLRDTINGKGGNEPTFGGSGDDMLIDGDAQRKMQEESETTRCSAGKRLGPVGRGALATT